MAVYRRGVGDGWYQRADDSTTFRAGGEFVGRLSVGTIAVLAFCALVLAGGIVPALGVETERSAHAEPGESLPTEPDGVGDWFERSFDAVNRVSFDIDRETGIDVSVSVGETDIGFSGLGNDDSETAGAGQIEHGAIDDGVERSANTGLCAVGLLDDDAPASIDVDGNNSTVRAVFDDSPASDEERAAAAADEERAATAADPGRASGPAEDRIDPMEIAERCGAGEGYGSAQ